MGTDRFLFLLLHLHLHVDCLSRKSFVATFFLFLSWASQPATHFFGSPAVPNQATRDVLLFSRVDTGATPSTVNQLARAALVPPCSCLALCFCLCLVRHLQSLADIDSEVEIPRACRAHCVSVHSVPLACVARRPVQSGASARGFGKYVMAKWHKMGTGKGIK